MIIIGLSNPATVLSEPNEDPVHLFLQFFVHRDEARHREFQLCLRKNVENPIITHIHLLGERIFSNLELGITSDKIIQTNLGKRLRFSDVFSYIRTNAIQGYHIIINSDIFLDNTLSNLKKSDIHLSRKMFAQLRFEYNSLSPKKSKIFGPRIDSQDTWIFHSNFPIQEKQESIFNFEFGKPGCDNKLIYLMDILGYEVINHPEFIKTYHVHINPTRDYGYKDRIKMPYSVIAPANRDPTTFNPTLGFDMKKIAEFTRNFQDIRFDDNTYIYKYLLEKIQTGTPFVLPRVAGTENNFAVFARIAKLQGSVQPGIADYIKQYTNTMKTNAGIKLSNMQSVYKYSDLYLKSFDNCDIMAGWELQGGVFGHISQSYTVLKQMYPNKKIIWSSAFDIFHYIYTTPWTHALKGKRVLIISPFEDSIKEKLPIREKIYGIDLFPECEITTIKPPQTQSGEKSDEFDIELDRFLKKLDAIKDTYDVALVSCGGYGNLVCNHIFESGKSSVYVGGVLQMYFGIWGMRWLKDRPDVMRLFLNEHWSRPKENERPIHFGNVEGGCYW